MPYANNHSVRIHYQVEVMGRPRPPAWLYQQLTNLVRLWVCGRLAAELPAHFN